MNIRLFSVLLLLSPASLQLGCTGGSSASRSVEPIPYDRWRVHLQLSQPLVRDYPGRADTVKITVRVTDENQAGVGGERIDFHILEGPGEIVSLDSLTGEDGKLHALFVVTINYFDDYTWLRVDAPRSMQWVHTAIRMEPIDIHLDLVPERRIAFVPKGREGRIELTVRVFDPVTGVLLPEIPLRLDVIGGRLDAHFTPLLPTNRRGISTTTLVLEDIDIPETVTVLAHIDMNLDFVPVNIITRGLGEQNTLEFVPVGG